jgi:hypothetical protein
LVAGPKGLVERGFRLTEADRFGALPPDKSSRDELSFKLHRFIRRCFPHYQSEKRGNPLIGIPGFWQDASGRVRLWKKTDYGFPFLVIPYRSAEGYIQACQLRSSDPETGKGRRYCWLSSASERNGIGTSDPVHFTFIANKCPANTPLLITEGALKAEAFVSLRPNHFAIATSGVGNSHAALISASGDRDVLIAFDSDHRWNPTVCGQLASLIAERFQHAASQPLTNSAKIVVWDGQAKGIDDAVLQGIRLNSLTIPQWLTTLQGKPLERVREVWDRLNFNL